MNPQAPAPPPHFLSLPLEIRLQIYKAYLSLTPLHLHISNSKQHWHKQLRLENPFIPLLCTSQQIRNEVQLIPTSALLLSSQTDLTITLNAWHLRKLQPKLTDGSLPAPIAHVRHLVFTDVICRWHPCPDLRPCRNLRTITMRTHQHRRAGGVGEQWNGTCADFGRTWPNAVHPSVEARVCHHVDDAGGLWRRVVHVDARVVGVVNTSNVREDLKVTRGEVDLPLEQRMGALLAVVSQNFVLSHYAVQWLLTWKH